jgi:hypothetical protein
MSKAFQDSLSVRCEGHSPAGLLKGFVAPDFCVCLVTLGAYNYTAGRPV